MSSQRQVPWTAIALGSLALFLVVAAVSYALLDGGERWIAGALLAFGVVDAAFLAFVMPRLMGAERTPPPEGP